MAHRTATVELDERLAAFIEAQLAEGRFADEAAVLEAGLRRLEEDDRKLAELRVLIEEGDASGESDRTLDEIWTEALASYRQRNG